MTDTGESIMLGMKQLQSRVRYVNSNIVSERCIKDLTHLIVRILADEFKDNPYGTTIFLSRYTDTINQFTQEKLHGTQGSS